MASLNVGEALRILLVSPKEEVRTEIGEALRGRMGEHRLYWVAEPDLALTRATDLIPHVVLVDDDLAGASPVALISQLVAHVPGAILLLLAKADAVATAQQAVLSGARGFVNKPIQPEDLVATLRQLLGQRRGGGGEPEEAENATGRIVAFCAPKGGTGRTILAINTAISLQGIVKRPIALVDADFTAPALDVALNLQGEHNIVDLLPKMSQLDRQLVASVLANHVSGIKVLLAPPPADLSSPISLPQVQQVLVWLRRMFPWVIVDLGLPLDETAFAFLDGADRIVMSVLPEMIGLRNTRLMLDQLYGRGYPDEKVWLILNRSTLPGGVTLRDIEARLRVQVKFRIPDDQPLVTHTINRGVPLVMSHKNSAVARAIRDFAGALAQDLTGASGSVVVDEASGVLGRLRKRGATAKA